MCLLDHATDRATEIATVVAQLQVPFNLVAEAKEVTNLRALLSRDGGTAEATTESVEEATEQRHADAIPVVDEAHAVPRVRHTGRQATYQRATHRLLLDPPTDVAGPLALELGGDLVIAAHEAVLARADAQVPIEPWRDDADQDHVRNDRANVGGPSDQKLTELESRNLSRLWVTVDRWRSDVHCTDVKVAEAGPVREGDHELGQEHPRRSQGSRNLVDGESQWVRDLHAEGDLHRRAVGMVLAGGISRDRSPRQCCAIRQGGQVPGALHLHILDVPLRASKGDGQGQRGGLAQLLYTWRALPRHAEHQAASGEDSGRLTPIHGGRAATATDEAALHAARGTATIAVKGVAVVALFAWIVKRQVLLGHQAAIAADRHAEQACGVAQGAVR
mmetsp:Transcript_130766/g.279710  ORF Transcript_130766/g.279710 Transcript_130766/m.279710 type:complete len:390 (+) Transcript_130766:223-1392(+)